MEVVEINEEHVEIGEQDNVCVLTKSEWEVLKQKILNKEIGNRTTRIHIQHRKEVKEMAPSLSGGTGCGAELCSLLTVCPPGSRLSYRQRTEVAGGVPS